MSLLFATSALYCNSCGNPNENWKSYRKKVKNLKKCLKNSSIKIQDQDEKNRKRYIEPDFIIFIVQSRRICKIIELKDGDNFDTKKVLGEKEHLRVFANEFSRKIPFATEFYFCCFNQFGSIWIYH